MSLQRLFAVCVVLSCHFCFAPFSGFLAAGQGEAASQDSETEHVLEPDGIGELKNLADKLEKAMKQQEETMKRLKEAHVFIAHVQKFIEQTRNDAVQALRHSQASQSEQVENVKAPRTKAEEDYRTAKTRLEVAEIGLREQVVEEIGKFEQMLQDEEDFIRKRESVLQALRDTMEVLTFLDDEPAMKLPVPSENSGTETRKSETPASGSGSSLPKSEPSIDRQAQRAEFLRRQVDPFFLQPLVTPIPIPEDLGDFSRQAMGDSNDSGDFTGSDCVLDYRFDHPARFPLPAYGSNGEQLEKPGVLIYEGMRLAIRPDGRYQVRFTVGTPAMPVTLQLQYQLLDECTGQTYTLTLPSITLPTENRPTLSTVSQPPRAAFADFQTIHHEGYLPIFEDMLEFRNMAVIRRNGTARFGYGLRVP
jgi:hypothetical protein